MSKLTRRSLLGGALMLGLAACSQGESPTSTSSPGGASNSPSNSQPSKLTVGLTYVPDIQFGLLYAAEKLGYFAEEGLEVTLRHHGAQEKLLGALQTGDEDVVFAGGGETLQGRSEGIPIRAFATAYQDYPVRIIVPADSPIQELADLAGHSVGLPGEYGENWFYLLDALRLAGLKREDVDIQSIGYTQFAALTGDKVDAVVGFVNNDLVRFEEDGFATRTLEFPEPSLISVGFSALDDTITARSDELKAFVRAAARGAQLCQSDPEQVVEIAVDYVPTLSEPEQQAHALAVLKATAELYGEDFGQMSPGRWDQMATFFDGEGLLANPITGDEAFTTEIVDAL